MSIPEYDSKEVEKHNKEDDVWLMLHGKVYNVTRFLEDHPGGPEILQRVAGTDATEDFEEVFHSDNARQQTQQYLIGTVKGYSGNPDAILKPSGTGSIKTVGGQSSRAKLLLIPFILVVVAVLYNFYR